MRQRALTLSPGLLPRPLPLLRPVLGKAKIYLPPDQCRNDELSCLAIWLIYLPGNASCSDIALSCLNGFGG